MDLWKFGCDSASPSSQAIPSGMARVWARRRPHREDIAMFEETQEEDKQSSRRGVIIVITVVVVLAIVGALIYLDSKGALSSSSSSSSSAATTAGTPVPASQADATKDLHVLSATMDKDSTGLVAVWLVNVKNSSSTLTYSHIKYQTTYGGADNSVIGQNQGEIPITIGPGEEQSAQFRDAQYPTATAWYRVTIMGASATQ
jgi:hypothetical protein